MVSAVLYLTSEIPRVIIKVSKNPSFPSFMKRGCTLCIVSFLYLWR
nr:MAG TPA: hypothetical protein [Caudoviricetes sp.]